MKVTSCRRPRLLPISRKSPAQEVILHSQTGRNHLPPRWIRAKRSKRNSDLKRLLLSLLAAAALAPTAAANKGTVYYTFVSEYGMAAKLEAKYDYASCSGIRRLGSQSLNTSQWGWVRGYRRFECSYDTQCRQCYGGQFEANVVKRNGRWGSWYPRMLTSGRCYAR